MQDILKKKNKIIDLRNKKITSTKIPVIAVGSLMPVIETPTKKDKPFQGGTFPCVDCKDISAQEFGRCEVCDTKHRQIVVQLAAKPKMPESVKISPKLTYRKEVINGVIVTVSTFEPLRI